MLDGRPIICKIPYADFNRAILCNAELIGSDISNATFWDADLSGASLSHANLTGADLLDVNLSATELNETNLSGAKLTNTGYQGIAELTGLTQAQLDEARADPDNPPILEGVRDAETGNPLIWRGKPLWKMSSLIDPNILQTLILTTHRQLSGRVSSYPSGLTTRSGSWLSLNTSRPMVNVADATSRSFLDARLGGNATRTR